MYHGTRQCSRFLSIIAVLLLSGLSTQSAFSSNDSIKMAIISLAPPAKIYRQWQEFADYLSSKTGREVKIIVPRGFKKIKSAVEDKTVDIFYVNSHIFYKLTEAQKAEPLAQMMNLDGSIYSNSVMFVRKDSGIDSLQQLKGEKIAFVAPMGAGGYLAPRAAFYDAGIQTKVDTEEKFTKNLTSSVHKVLLGDVKAGTMCGLNYKLMSERIKTGDLKIIASSADYPENVFGIRADLPAALKKQISEVMIGMDKDINGRKILDGMKGMKIKKFVKYDPETEHTTRALRKSADFK